MAQGTILREAPLGPLMKPLVYTQNELLPWPGTQRKNLLHVWAVSIAPASLCNATHKISFSFFILCSKPGIFLVSCSTGFVHQPWCCTRSSPSAALISSSGTGDKLFLFCDIQAWLPAKKKDVCALGQFLGGKGWDKEVLLRPKFLFQTLSWISPAVQWPNHVGECD